VVFDEAQRDGGRSQRLLWPADFELPFEDWRVTPTSPCGCCTSDALAAAATQRIRERSRAFLTHSPRATGVSFEKNESRGVPGGARETTTLCERAEGLETEFAAMAQSRRSCCAFRAGVSRSPELSFLLEIPRTQFRLLVRAPKQGVFLAATPIDVSQSPCPAVRNNSIPIVLTSAHSRLPALDFIRQRLGLDHAREGALPPELIGQNKRFRYMPRAIPDVRHPAFFASSGR